MNLKAVIKKTPTKTKQKNYQQTNTCLIPAFLCSTADPFPLCSSIPQLCMSCFPYGNSMSQNGNLMQLRTDRTGSGWDGVNFLQGSQNGDVLWLWN